MRIWTPILIFLFAIGAAHAQNITFTDKAGKMVVRSIASWSTKLTDAKTIHFKAKGSPLSAAWPSQGLTVTANMIEGDAIRTDAGLVLKGAILSGKVHTVAIRAKQTITTDSETATITMEGAKTSIVLAGGVSIDSVSPEIGQTLHASATSGSLGLMDPKGLTTAMLEGEVHIKTMRRGNGIKPVTMTADCKRLDLDVSADPGLMTLTGNVKISGTEPALAGDIEASKVVITLDPNFQPTQVEATGEPGITHVRDRASGVVH